MLLPACCCNDCIIFGDLFDRADGAIGSPWVNLQGSWAIVGEQATIGSPTAADATFVNPTEYPDVFGAFPYGWFAEAALTSSDAGDEVGIMFIGRTDTDGYRAYATITFHDDEGEALLKVYKWEVSFPPDPPVETLLATAHITAPPGELQKLKACRSGPSTVPPRWSFFLDEQLVIVVESAIFSGTPGAHGGVGLIVRSATGTPVWEYAVSGKSGTVNCQCYGCVTSNRVNDFTHDAPLLRFDGGTGGANWDVDGGRLVNNNVLGSRNTAYTCAYTLGNQLEIDFEASVVIYWDVPGFDTNLQLGLVFGRRASPGGGGVNNRRLELSGNPEIGTGAFPPVTEGWSYAVYDASGSAIESGTIPATPAQGDVLAIRITADGTGTYTVQFKVNGSVIHTESAVDLDHPDFPGYWEYGVFGSNNGYGQFDDLAIDFSP